MIKAVPPARFMSLGDFPIKRRLPDKNDLRSGFLRFLPVLNNPWNLALARRRAAPGCPYWRKSSTFGLIGLRIGTLIMPKLDFRSSRLFVDAALTAGETVALERSQS